MTTVYVDGEIEWQEPTALSTLNEYPSIMTVREVAQFLRIGKREVYEMIVREQLPSIRIGRLIRIKKVDLKKVYGPF